VLAAEADLVIAVDGGGSVCLEAGVRPDVVVGDFDSLPHAHLDSLRGLGARIQAHPADKDASDLDLAIAEARRRGAASLIVTAASSGRLDHTLAVLGALSAASDLRAHLAEPDLDVWVLSPEGRSKLTLVGAESTLSIMAVSGPAVVSAEGVVWEVSDLMLDPGSSRGLSNRVGASGRALISVSSGVVLVISPQVAGTVRAQGA
jgi:thiamine pyrophosphokinase